MRMKTILVSALLMTLAGTAPGGYPQAKKRSGSAPRIEVREYRIEAALTPDAHELKAAAVISFRPVDAMDFIVFELSENLSVQKVLNSEGVELEFGQVDRARLDALGLERSSLVASIGLAFDYAEPQHGGEGALYVLLKRKKETAR